MAQGDEFATSNERIDVRELSVHCRALFHADSTVFYRNAASKLHIFGDDREETQRISNANAVRSSEMPNFNRILTSFLLLRS